VPEPEPEPAEPVPELSPPGERPVVEPAAAPFVDDVGGLPETLSFLATFFFAFFDFVFACVSSLATVVLLEDMPVLRSRADDSERLSALLSSLANAVVVSTELLPETVEPAGRDVLAVEFVSILALVPFAVLLLSEYELPCGFCELAGTVGDASALTLDEAAGVAGAVAPAVELSLLPLGIAWLVALLLIEPCVLDVVELVVASGDCLFFLKSPMASALPAAKAMIEVVRNTGASLRMRISLG